MAKRPCLTCGALSTGSRCPPCTKAKAAPRQAYKAQRYDTEYDRSRRAWQARMDAGEQVTCSRCPDLVNPARWDQDHHPVLGLWPAHPRCNRSAH